MYSTCLFCNGSLGANQVIEQFPVGRRLAFDAAKGRLWVVCRKCERWNLTPLEERWEAIEECEKRFRETRLRVSTDHIGLARLKEGLELVRIGEPQRPEMAAWRYGDQFGRRRRRHVALVLGGAAVAGTAIVAGPVLGLVGFGAVNPLFQLVSTGSNLYRSRKMIHLNSAQHPALRIRFSEMRKTTLHADGTGIRLRVTAAVPKPARFWWNGKLASEHTVDLTGDEAIRAAGALLPHMNHGGGSRRDVREAVDYLESAGDPARLFRDAVGVLENIERQRKSFGFRDKYALKNLNTASRLALEMAAHEDSERRALEGELHVLEAAWQAAEEIAGIADDMFLPASMDADLARLKATRDEQP